MSTLLMILITLNAWTQGTPTPTPSGPPPVDIDAVCAKARAQDAANANNPAYAQSDVSAQCAEINASKKGSKLENRLGKLRIVSTTTCGVATGICMIGNANPKIKKVGKTLAKVCGGMGFTLGTIDTVAQGALNNELNKDNSAFNAMGLLNMGKDIYTGIGGIKDMGEAFTNGPKPGKDKNGDKKPSCETIGEATLAETREMATHFDSSSSLAQARRDAEKELQKNVAQGGSVSTDFNSNTDQDGNPLVNAKEEDEGDLPGFPEDLASEFEDATGMNVDDILNSDESPEDLTADIANALGLDAEAMKRSIASTGAVLPGSDSMTKLPPETDGTVAAGSMRSIASNSNDTFKVPDLSGLFKKNEEHSPAAKKDKNAKDFSKMTAAELEKDTKHNLFLRVSYRYEQEQTQLEKLLWASKLNAHLNPKPLDTLSKRFPASKMP